MLRSQRGIVFVWSGCSDMRRARLCPWTDWRHCRMGGSDTGLRGPGAIGRPTIFEPLEFLEKLAALVPTPRAHLVRFHGLLAPAAKWRPAVVPNTAIIEPPLDSPDISTITAASSGLGPADGSETQKPVAERHRK